MRQMVESMQNNQDAQLLTEDYQEHEASGSDVAVGILRERLERAEAKCTRLAQEKDSMVAKIDAAEKKSARDDAKIAELEAEIRRLKGNNATKSATGKPVTGTFGHG